jgi:hypothetical protein
MKNINIPEPCSENWNEMTPTEKGGFCQKCALDVYDFTNKSGDEIRDILTLNIGSRVCGRIEPKQLNELNTDFSAWRITNKRSYQRAWVFTLFVVFGMTLFSCEDDEVLAVKKLQKTTQTILNKLPKQQIVEMGELTNPEFDQKTGQIQLVDEPIDPPVPEELELLGELVDIVGEIEYYEKYPVKETEIPERNTEGFTYTMGAMVSTVHYTEFLIDSTSLTSCEANKMSGLVYPNPASNQTTLKVNMPSRGKAEIELFGLNGQKIKTIHSGRIRKGESEYPIDLTDLETGMYLVVIYSNENKETVKFSKI